MSSTATLPAGSTRPASGYPLTPEQLQSFGEELDAIRRRVIADRGERDANYIRGVIRAQRGLEVAGRGLLWAGVLPPAWLAGTAALRDGPLQRAFRDLHAAAQHFFASDAASIDWARGLLATEA